MTKYKINVQKIVLFYIIQKWSREVLYIVIAATSNTKYLVTMVTWYTWDLYEKTIKIYWLGRLSILTISVFPIFNILKKFKTPFPQVNFWNLTNSKVHL